MPLNAANRYTDFDVSLPSQHLTVMIGGIVLAGGESKRMGTPKATLEVDGVTFLQRAVSTLTNGGCEEVVVVINPEHTEEVATAAELGVRSVAGGARGTQQIDSLRAGIRTLSGAVTGAVVLPVDHPFVRSETVESLIAAFRARCAPIVIPVYRDKHGHPVLFSAAVFEELLHGDLPEGARSIVHGHAEELDEVAVDDGGILIDIDTPEDYERSLEVGE